MKRMMQTDYWKFTSLHSLKGVKVATRLTIADIEDYIAFEWALSSLLKQPILG